MTIKIAQELELPLDGITQTYAQIGKRGSGKTYLASMIAEQMLDAQAQVIVMDPIGNWWGLRVDADGKSKGKDIFIIGGSHGDVPLASEGGKEIAKLLVEKSISVVLDISEFRKNERKKFVTDFAEEFFQLKKSKPSAVHIFLEESQKFIPQTVRGDDARMVGAWEDIVRLGRNYGIGCSLITQRPQSVNKEVLSQVECLCVLQVVGRHERKALEEWIREAGEDRSIIDKLPSLHQGEGYVWSPSWLRIFKKVNFNKKTTFDTSATPKLGEATKSAKISKMDIEKLREQMTTVVEKISKDKLDRKGLIGEIERLKKELRISQNAQVKPLVKVDEKGLERSIARGFKESERKNEKLLLATKNYCKQIEKKVIDAGKILGQEIKEVTFTHKSNVLSNIKVPYQKPVIEVTHESNQSVTSVSNGELGICAKKIYSFLYNHPERAFSKPHIGAFTGYSHKSGGFSNAVSQLNSNGLITRSNGSFEVRNMDPNLAEEYDFSKEAIMKNLGACAKKIYQLRLDNPYEEYSKELLDEITDYSLGSGGFSNALSKLNSLGLIIKNGSIKLNPELMEI